MSQSMASSVRSDSDPHERSGRLARAGSMSVNSKKQYQEREAALQKKREEDAANAKNTNTSSPDPSPGNSRRESDVRRHEVASDVIGDIERSASAARRRSLEAKEDAAVKIQSQFRGHRTRQHSRPRMEDRRREQASSREDVRKEDAATVIQAHERGRQTRSRSPILERKKAASRSSSPTKEDSSVANQNEREEKERASATKIQKIARQRAARKEVHRRRDQRQRLEKETDERQEIEEDEEELRHANVEDEEKARDSIWKEVAEDSQRIADEEAKKEGQAATRIQSIQRGRMARRQLNERRAAREEDHQAKSEEGEEESKKEVDDSEYHMVSILMDGTSEDQCPALACVLRSIRQQPEDSEKVDDEEQEKGADEQKEENASATKIQSIARRRAARKEADRRREIRDRLEKDKDDREAMEDNEIEMREAHTKDEQTARDALWKEVADDAQRIADEDAKKEGQAATRIQSIQRGRMARKEINERRAQQEEEERKKKEAEKKENEAATRIQSMQRGRVARRQAEERRAASEKAEEEQRKNESERKERESASATTIQCAARRRAARKEANRRRDLRHLEERQKDERKDMEEEESTARGSVVDDEEASRDALWKEVAEDSQRIADEESKKEGQAATRIQSIQRGRMARKQLNERRAAREQEEKQQEEEKTTSPPVSPTKKTTKQEQESVAPSPFFRSKYPHLSAAFTVLMARLFDDAKAPEREASQEKERQSEKEKKKQSPVEDKQDDQPAPEEKKEEPPSESNVNEDEKESTQPNKEDEEKRNQEESPQEPAEEKDPKPTVKDPEPVQKMEETKKDPAPKYKPRAGNPVSPVLAECKEQLQRLEEEEANPQPQKKEEEQKEGSDEPSAEEQTKEEENPAGESEKTDDKQPKKKDPLPSSSPEPNRPGNSPQRDTPYEDRSFMEPQVSIALAAAFDDDMLSLEFVTDFCCEFGRLSSSMLSHSVDPATLIALLFSCLRRQPSHLSKAISCDLLAMVLCSSTWCPASELCDLVTTAAGNVSPHQEPAWRQVIRRLFETIDIKGTRLVASKIVLDCIRDEDFAFDLDHLEDPALRFGHLCALVNKDVVLTPAFLRHAEEGVNVLVRKIENELPRSFGNGLRRRRLDSANNALVHAKKLREEFKEATFKLLADAIRNQEIVPQGQLNTFCEIVVDALDLELVEDSKHNNEEEPQPDEEKKNNEPKADDNADESNAEEKESPAAEEEDREKPSTKEQPEDEQNQDKPQPSTSPPPKKDDKETKMRNLVAAMLENKEQREALGDNGSWLRITKVHELSIHNLTTKRFAFTVLPQPSADGSDKEEKQLEALELQDCFFSLRHWLYSVSGVSSNCAPMAFEVRSVGNPSFSPKKPSTMGPTAPRPPSARNRRLVESVQRTPSPSRGSSARACSAGRERFAPPQQKSYSHNPR